MRVHRFFVGADTHLKHDFWMHDEGLLHQWNKVLRFKTGQEVVLFDGVEHDRLYKIDELRATEAHLIHVTDFDRKVPQKNVYVLWALLKKDKNDWVLQKCTELGASHFIPLIADRSEKTGFNHDRAQKIVIEAAEQCGRSDIPAVREPMHVAKAIEQLDEKATLYICEQDGVDTVTDASEHLGVLIGPEGGWSDGEKALFKEKGIKHLNLHEFTLRAETAAVTATGKLIQ